jgi:hypothetical protein
MEERLALQATCFSADQSSASQSAIITAITFFGVEAVFKGWIHGAAWRFSSSKCRLRHCFAVLSALGMKRANSGQT